MAIRLPMFAFALAASASLATESRADTASDSVSVSVTVVDSCEVYVGELPTSEESRNTGHESSSSRENVPVELFCAGDDGEKTDRAASSAAEGESGEARGRARIERARGEGGAEIRTVIF